MAEKDFLDELIEEGTRRTPLFPEMVDAAYRRRALLRNLAARRQAAGITQREVASQMRTSQASVGRLERGELDATLVTIERYAAIIGHRVEWRLSKAKARSGS